MVTPNPIPQTSDRLPARLRLTAELVSESAPASTDCPRLALAFETVPGDYDDWTIDKLLPCWLDSMARSLRLSADAIVDWFKDAVDGAKEVEVVTLDDWFIRRSSTGSAQLFGSRDACVIDGISYDRQEWRTSRIVQRDGDVVRTWSGSAYEAPGLNDDEKQRADVDAGIAECILRRGLPTWLAVRLPPEDRAELLNSYRGVRPEQDGWTPCSFPDSEKTEVCA